MAKRTVNMYKPLNRSKKASSAPPTIKGPNMKNEYYIKKASLGSLFKKTVVVAKTRKLNSKWCYVKTLDGNFFIHVDNMPRYKKIDFAHLTCDAAEKEMMEADIIADDVDDFVRTCIKKTKDFDATYYEKCLKQRLKDGIGSTTDCETVEDMEKALMSAHWSVWTAPNNVISPGCVAFVTKDIPGYHGMLDINQIPDGTVCHFRDVKNTGFLSLCTKTDTKKRVNFTVLIAGPEDIGYIMYTFHPGEPVPASTFKSGELNESAQTEVYNDGDVITVKTAKELGFKLVKAEQ